MFKHPDFQNLFVVNHPLIQHKLTHMRNKETSTKTFRALLHEISLLMGYEITHDLPLTTKVVETPLTTIEDAPVLEGRKIGVVPILRAGQGMSDGLLELMPSARVGHIGLYRDPKTKLPVEYLVKLPEVEGRTFILCDPMMATGHSASYAVDVLNRAGVADEDIRLLILVASPEGMIVFQKEHPKVPVFTASLDSHLNEKAYIIPGLGDAGDRLFVTV